MNRSAIASTGPVVGQTDVPIITRVFWQKQRAAPKSCIRLCVIMKRGSSSVEHGIRLKRLANIPQHDGFSVSSVALDRTSGMMEQTSAIRLAPETQIPARDAGRLPGWFIWVLVFLGAFALYAISASPEVHWQDAGQYERVARGELEDSFGLCRDHPLHFWMSTAASKLLPVTLPLAMSLVSALAGAISVANVFGIVRQWTGQTKAALLAAAGLLVGASFWQFSCIQVLTSLKAALLTTEFWALLNWDLTRRPTWLVILFLLNGIGLANHNLALLELPDHRHCAAGCGLPAGSRVADGRFECPHLAGGLHRCTFGLSSNM